MTTANIGNGPLPEQEAGKGKPAKDPGARLLAGLVTDLGLTAAFSWAAGMVLNAGCGVHAPFAAAWLLSLISLWGSQAFLGQLVTVWHFRRVEADINLLAASMAAQDAVQKDATDGLADFFRKLDKDADTDNGAYL